MTTSPVPSDTDRPAEPRNYLAAMQAEYDAKPLTERLLDYFDESDTECLPPVILDALAKLADAEQARDEAIRVAGANAVAYDDARAEVVSLQARLTAAEEQLAAVRSLPEVEIGRYWNSHSEAQAQGRNATLLEVRQILDGGDPPRDDLTQTEVRNRFQRHIAALGLGEGDNR